MYTKRADFVYTVTRDFVRSCQTPILACRTCSGAPVCRRHGNRAPAPHAEATVYPWKEPKELRAKTVQHVHDFLRAHKPVMA